MTVQAFFVTYALIVCRKSGRADGYVWSGCWHFVDVSIYITEESAGCRKGGSTGYLK